MQRLRALVGGFALLWSAAAYPASPSGNAPTQAELDAADTDAASWLTYNKGYLGYRFSPLTAINTTTASQVRVLCEADLGYHGAFESGLVAYGGLIYATAALSTYAIDASTCALRWSYAYPAKVGAGVINRGVALAGGRLFRGTGDGHLIALDAATGAPLWDQQAMDSSIGEVPAGAPIAWNGLVFLGKAGGDRGIQGEVMAFDQVTGAKVWGFHTVPSPGEFGAASWPTAFSIAHGGGGTWTTFTLDEARGLLIFPVGNPGPDNNASVRKGRNLFTTAVVALNAKTGTLSWYHQLLSGDYHDWDTTVAAAFPSSGGVDLAAAAGKDGVLHVVDRSDGALRYTANLVTHYLNDRAPVPGGTGIRICPVQAVQWNGPSYSPPTNLIVMSGIDWCTQAIQGPTPVYVVDKPYTGWANGAGGAKEPVSTARGLMSAFDANTGALMWRTALPALPLGGVVTTAGGVVVTGGIDDQVVILDAQGGKILAKVGLGQPIAGGVVSFEVGTTQRLAVAAGHTSSSYGISGNAAVFVLGIP